MGFPFMQGQLLKDERAEIGGAASWGTSTTGNWYNVGNADVPARLLAIAYTPPVSGYVDFNINIGITSDTANQRFMMRMLDNYPGGNQLEPLFYGHIYAANNRYSYPWEFSVPIVADTAYYFIVQIQLISAGALTVYRESLYTRLDMRAHANP